jgi:hypothetical protein
MPTIDPALIGGLLGAGLGAGMAPRGRRAEGAARGGLHGLAIDTGMGIGGSLGALAGNRLAANPVAGTVIGGLAGLGLGGLGGHTLARAGMDGPSWDRGLPHGISGDDDDEDDGRAKAASFAARMGALAARTRK